MLASLKVARGIFIAIGAIFFLSGVIVTTLRLIDVIPPSYNWQGSLFLVLGAIGVATAVLGLRSPRVWPLIILGFAYIPWTVIGLVGDIGQGFWPLVLGESLGIGLFAWASASVAVVVLPQRKPSNPNPKIVSGDTREVMDRRGRPE